MTINTPDFISDAYFYDTTLSSSGGGDSSPSIVIIAFNIYIVYFLL